MFEKKQWVLCTYVRKKRIFVHVNEQSTTDNPLLAMAFDSQEHADQWKQEKMQYRNYKSIEVHYKMTFTETF